MGKNRLKSLILNDVAHFFVRSSFEGHLCYDDLLAWNTTIIINMSTTSTLRSTQNNFQNQDWVWFHYGSCRGQVWQSWLPSGTRKLVPVVTDIVIFHCHSILGLSWGILLGKINSLSLSFAFPWNILFFRILV